ncbi:exported hypothetical protein [Candidatus Sulfopaludibacter sp. SbA3]|nr:exported hypothetical protein [Candidatus Sulfopaludibacter sp. SbA3]
MIGHMVPKAICLCCILAAAGFAQAPDDVVFRQKFQGDTGNWTILGQHASMAPSPDSRSLAFTYEVAPKIFSGLVSPAPADFAKMQRMRFHVKTDHATAMAILISEKKPGGGNYSTWFWSPANTWQWVEVTPADFSLNDGPGDPKDTDGKLDLADVEGFGLFDLGSFFAQTPANADFPVMVQVDKGQHTAILDGFEVLSSPPAPPRLSADGIRIGTLDRSFIDWVTLGGMDLKLNAGENPLKAPALEVSYKQAEGQFQVLLRRVAGSEMAKAKRLVFDVASEHDITLMISLEMTKPGGGQGPRFTLPIYPPGGKEVIHVNLDLSDFQGDGKFDPAQWRSLAIADITVAGGGAPDANTIWIGNLAAMKE